MSWAQQLSALYTALHDANDVGQILKDLPGSDPTKAVVTVTYNSIPTLVAELVVLATRMGEKGLALACLESIFHEDVLAQDDVRAQTSRKQILLWLRDQLNETCTLVIPSDEGMRYVDRAEIDSPLRISFPVGSIVPFHCTASGKLYLSTLSKDEVRHLIEVAGLTQFSVETITSIDALEAELEVIRGQGFAIDHQEFLAGTIAIGVPVFDFKRRLSLILTVQAPVFRLPLDAVEHCLPILREAANRLELMMQPDAAS